ncbi:iron transporter [Nautilia sp. PV-1]|uniref:FeoA family protein n=1 Tax=Nautilia sp. PV-1 TaxID=2579250 RepID=UPI000FD8707D|nr:FeoA family protein [Nautilia sp. PV-1]AZV46092.1 iron transporter [Nautilia sp. PV-1]
MRLNELTIGDEATVKKVHAKEPLKSRLFAFGIAKGQKVKVLKHTLAKNTFEIEIGNTKVALRDEEAADVEVEKDVK